MFQEDTLPELERAFEILNERPLHIETDTSYMFQQAYDPDFFFLLLDILEASPLLTPYTDSPDGWLLEFNEETLAGILSLVDHEVNQYEIDNTQADIRDMGVYMNIKDIRNSHIGIPVDQEDAVGEFTLTRANKNYELTGRVDGVGYAEGNEFEITLREGYASSHLTTFGVEFYSLLWENGYLNFDATDGGLMTFSLAGQFQPDDFHLKAKYNGTSVGYINYEMTGQSATFSMAIDLRDLVSGDFYIELTSESSWNEGRYIITFPATVWSEDEFYEELYK